MRAFRCGANQIAALQIYVLDPAIAEDEPFPGCLEGSLLLVDDLDLAYRLLAEGANSADVDRDRPLERALAGLARRVLYAEVAR